MAVLLGRTTIHRAAVNWRGGYGLTACGIGFEVSDPEFLDMGRYDDDDFVVWVRETYGRLLCPCSHCSNRLPAWKKRYKRRNVAAWAKKGR
jgi:hypothetical protein